MLFRYKYEAFYSEELEQEIYGLELSSHEDELKADLEEAEIFNNNLLNICQFILSDEKKTLEEIETEIKSSCIKWEDEQELLELIQKLRENKKED